MSKPTQEVKAVAKREPSKGAIKVDKEIDKNKIKPKV
jgi:hypothetical protein